MAKTLILLMVLTNMARFNVGFLVEDVRLDTAAQIRAEHLCAVNQFGHKDWEDSFRGLEYGWHGENLAKGSSDMRRVSDALYASPLHKANIMNPHFTDIGLGYDPKCKLVVELYGG